MGSGLSKAAKRRRDLAELRGGARAPIEWTWDSFIAEEGRRTIQTALLAGVIRETSYADRAVARLGNRLAGVYLRLWTARQPYHSYGPAPPIWQLASGAPPSYRDLAAAWPGEPWLRTRHRDLEARLAMFGDLCLRSPRLQRPLPGRLDEPTWADERRVRLALEAEIVGLERILSDPSRRARERTRV